GYRPGIDHLDLRAFGFTSLSDVQALLTSDEGGTLIDFGGGNGVYVSGVQDSAFKPSDFILSDAPIINSVQFDLSTGETVVLSQYDFDIFDPDSDFFTF